MALMTLTEVKDCLGVFHGNDDTKLTLFVNATESMITKYLGRDLAQAEYTQKYYKPCNDFLMVNNYPVDSLTSITIDDTVQTLTDFYVKEDTGVIHGEDFVDGDEIEIVYTGGFSPVPDLIKSVFCSVVEDLYNEYKGELIDDIKDVTLFDFAKVSFSAGSGSGDNSISYSGVDSSGEVPGPLKKYVGALNMYKSDVVNIGGFGVI